MLPILLDLLANFPAVALLGPRQVGKTTLSLDVAKIIPAIYLDLESDGDRMKFQDPELFMQHHHDQLIILDEVQRIPNIFQNLRVIIDRKRRQDRGAGQFLLLGSACVDLLKQTGESLAGRLAYAELTPLLAHEIPHEKNTDLWVRGGFPNSFLASNDKTSLKWRLDFIRTYLERDIPQFGFHIPAETLRRFWVMLAYQQGQLFNASQLAESLGVSSVTVSRYLDILVDLMLVRRLSPWFQNIGKRLIKSPKIYIRDSGLCHALLGLRNQDELLSNPVAGPSWEGFVIESLLSAGAENIQYHFYRTHAGAEIDLILTLPGNKKWAIEIKRSLAPKLEKGFYSAINDLNPEQCFVVYPGQDHFSIAPNIDVISLPKMIERLKAAC